MYVSSKATCPVFSGCVKERTKSTIGNSLFRVQTLMSIFGISTDLIGTVAVFFVLPRCTQKRDLCRQVYLYIELKKRSPNANWFPYD